MFNPLSPHNALIKASFYIPENRLNFHTTRGLRTNIKLHETGLPIHGSFLYFLPPIKSFSSTTSRELRQQFVACSDEDDNGKFRLEKVIHVHQYLISN